MSPRSKLILDTLHQIRDPKNIKDRQTVCLGIVATVSAPTTPTISGRSRGTGGSTSGRASGRASGRGTVSRASRCSSTRALAVRGDAEVIDVVLGIDTETAASKRRPDETLVLSIEAVGVGLKDGITRGGD